MEGAKLDRKVRIGQFFLLLAHIVNGTNGDFLHCSRSNRETQQLGIIL